MQTHTDASHRQSAFFDELRKRAEVGKQSGNAGITAGHEGEEELARWKASNGMEVCHRPDDPQGILRISVGGLHRVAGRCNHSSQRITGVSYAWTNFSLL